MLFRSATYANFLNFMSLNVCGLRNRLEYIEFLDLINAHDIIGFQETKTDYLDNLQIEGYTLYLKHRIGARRRSGGIGIAIRNKYVQFVTRVDDMCNYILWIRISKSLFKLDQDWYLGIVYIPPEGSKYANVDSFHDIEQSILHYNYTLLLVNMCH